MKLLRIFPAIFGAALPLTACQRKNVDRARQLTGGGDPDHGRRAINYYGCASCHAIPGIHGADGLIGPSLKQIGQRAYIGGVMENTPDNLIHWLENPPAIDPKTAMPNLHVTRADAKDIASYLYTLR